MRHPRSTSSALNTSNARLIVGDRVVAFDSDGRADAAKHGPFRIKRRGGNDVAKR